eukprot:gnl/MRDRNA2_/MRDRNA2_30353_c0_seq1.p1 gnl/MRDRNA2_/MRDRNA2_30353_c0~~gnl/MRDRNA2_/MRDRNA2_30353_c0_seq1.p1  ORF type:complete len:389 (+),score=90.89 gnl/MRDRNA2_/MRDRNA2_30353_c0_seq1:158-1168(+)
MEGKTVAITGSTTGTGLCLAQTCAKLGAQVVLLNRASDRVEKARASVEECASPASPDSKGSRASATEGQLKPRLDEQTAIEGKAPVMTIECDLSSFQSVHAACKELKTKFESSGIDVLCNNAGVMALKDQATKDGCDIQMQVNMISHFILTKEMMPLLETAAKLRGEARIVNHSSIARNDVKKKGLEAKYLQKNGGNLGGDGMSGRWTRYGMTKWANMVFHEALTEKLAAAGSKVKASIAHPGVAATNLQVTTNVDGGLPAMACHAIVKQTSNDGALGIIRGSCAADVESGSFFGPVKEGFKGFAENLPRDKECSDEQKKLLWEECEKTAGIKFGI